MDSLKTLMDKREYELVIKLTQNSTEPTSLFYRVSAFLASGKPNDALAVIDNNQKLLESSLSVLIKIHIEILCLLGKFDEAYEKYNYYSNLPYVSQNVEEILKAIPNYIRQEEKKSNSVRQFDDDELNKLLLSNKQEDVLMSLDIVKERDINKFMLAIQKVLVSFPKQSIRSLALLLLVQKQYSKEVKFNHLGEITIVNPSKLDAPFVDEQFNNVSKIISTSFKDPVVGENAIQIYSSYIIYMYPNKITYSDDELLAALFIISNEYLQSNVNVDEVCKNYSVEKSTIIELIEQIKKSLDTY